MGVKRVVSMRKKGNFDCTLENLIFDQYFECQKRILSSYKKSTKVLTGKDRLGIEISRLPLELGQTDARPKNNGGGLIAER